MKKIAILFFLSFFTLHLLAQFYQTGVEPFGTKWRQIRTDNYRILFPADADMIAFRYANLLSVIDSVAPKSLSAKQRVFDVVIHNHSTRSNGFVIWAPKRMEIIAQPPPTTYAQQWLKQLALHETRHTSQLFTLNSGIVKPASIFLGELSVGGASGFVPLWFFEGDAVAFETATSNTGRGHQADFYQYYRAHYFTAAKRFSYDKWLMGSYQDVIPNHYNFGYQLVSHAKTEYGNHVWANTLQYVSRYPFTLFPFYFGFKKQTGLSRKQLFENTFNALHSTWRSDQKSQNSINYQSLNKTVKEYSEYRYPYLIADSSVIAYKTSLSEALRFVIIDFRTRQERTLVYSGSMTSIPSYHKEHIFWTEYQPHIRWEYKNYSIIKWYNAKTGQVKTISDKGRYYSPVYNPDNGYIYAISGLDDGTNSISAFNLNGEKQISIPLPNEFQPFELTLNDINQLICSIVTNEGKSIIQIDQNGAYNPIYGPTYLDIHSIKSVGNRLFFSTTEGYKEDIFALNCNTKEIVRITNSAFGATDPHYNEKSNSLLFSSFSTNGYSISITKVDTTITPIDLTQVVNDGMIAKLRSTERFNIDSTDIPNKSFEIKNYRGLKTIANIHSWTPFYFDINKLIAGEVDIKPGVMLFSQNLTGTSVLSAGYGYNNAHLTRINYQYNGFFPAISYEFEIMDLSPRVWLIDKKEPSNIDRQKKESTFSIYIPLRFSSGGFSTRLNPIFQMVGSNEYILSINDSLYHKGLQQFNYRVYVSVLQNQTMKSIRPRLGFSADINFENAPFNRNNFGSSVSGVFLVYLPGIGKTHSLLIKPSFQKQSTKRYYLSNKTIFPRGYSPYYSELFKSISAEYLLPVAYPDLSIGSLAYLKRISLNTFFDYALLEFPKSTGVRPYQMKSFGVEIFTDFNLLRTRYPIRVKFQQGWAGSNLSPFNQFTFSVDFYGQ